MCQSANFHLRNIGKIRHLIDDETCKLLVHYFVTSRLDYCNSLLIGTSSTLIHSLQLVQNRAARIVKRVKKYDHITPVLKELHWLPVKERIEYKTLLTTYKVIHDNEPAYLSDLLEVNKSGRHLRSSDSIVLKQPVPKTKFSEKAFSVSAPRLWNSIPPQIRSSTTVDSFKRQLKTELFRRAYPC